MSVKWNWLVLMPILLRRMRRMPCRSSNAVVATIVVIHVYDGCVNVMM
jgi:hypothetical protein